MMFSWSGYPKESSGLFYSLNLDGNSYYVEKTTNEYETNIVIAKKIIKLMEIKKLKDWYTDIGLLVLEDILPSKWLFSAHRNLNLSFSECKFVSF